jgi:hypothetical protein
MIAMRFGVDDIAQLAEPLYFCFQAYGVARLMRRVDEHDAVGRGHNAVIGTLFLSFDDHVRCELLHKPPLSREEKKYIFPQRRKGAKFGKDFFIKTFAP